MARLDLLTGLVSAASGDGVAVSGYSLTRPEDAPPGLDVQAGAVLAYKSHGHGSVVRMGWLTV